MIDISDEEKKKEIERVRLLKEEIEIIQAIKEKVKKEIDKIDFLLTISEVNDMNDLIEGDVESYFNKRKERAEIERRKEYIVNDWEKTEFFKEILKKSFKELNILVKVNTEYSYNKNSILFKENESVLLAFLIENFRERKGIESSYEISITKQVLKNFIKFYDVKDDFIDRLRKSNILFENKIIKDELFISFKDSIYTDENEENFRKAILQNYSLRKNEKIKNELEEYSKKIKEFEIKTNELESSINNSKIEIITILGIFIGLFSYLSANFSFIKELLSNSKAIENIFLIIAVFCVGLIPVIIIFLLIKYLFLTPNDNLSIESKKLTFWKNFFPPSIIIMISIILVVAIIAIYMIFWNNYKEYNLKINKLEQEVKVKTEEIQKLEDEIKNIKIEYKKQKSNFRTKLREKNSEKFIFIN